VRSSRSFARGLVALCLTFLVVPSARPDAAAGCEIDGVQRVVAIGDVHGAYDRLVEILRAADLIDQRLRWTGGATHLVQTGDVVDRGPDSRKALDLLRRLEEEAPKSGGAVHALLGNHEAARMIGDLRYVVPGEYEAFSSADSERVRQAAAKALPAEEHEAFVKSTPLGQVEMRIAFGRDGQYGKWLRAHNAVIRINGVMFMHGGLSAAVASQSCTSINDTVRRDLTTDLEKTRSAPLTTLTAREDGPLWYRGLVQLPEPEVDAILTASRARAIVIAHTVTPTGRVVSRFGGKVFEIDTGMQPAYVPNGRASALEIKGDVWTAIYRDSREPVR
jgi:hypothetical protein